MSAGERVPILGTPVDRTDMGRALERIRGWAGRGESRCVCACNVHSVVTATEDPALAEALGGADLVVPDGMPVALAMRRHGAPGQRRISGPDLMREACAMARDEGLGVYLYGSTEATLALLRERLAEAFPGLAIAGWAAPPFRAQTAAEDAADTEAIAASGARLVFVGLGCPKQEVWMHAHRGRVPAVMLGVGAAFDFHAGVLRRAPRWMRRAGLEWLHRLGSEPLRLFGRYRHTGSVFLWHALRGTLYSRGAAGR